MKLNISSKIIVILYTITAFFWIMFVSATKYTGTLEGPNYTQFLQPFLIGMTIIPLIGGLIGLRNAFKWGGLTSVVGKSSLALSMGTIAWAGGMIIWNYYLFFTTVEVPYPSSADIIFILSWPFWSYGIWKLSEAIGIKFALRKMNKAFFIIPLTLIALSVYLSIFVARGGITYENNAIKLFFDLFYPLGDIVILTVTASVYLVLRKFLGGVYKIPIMILFVGFLLNYLGDFIFVFTTSKETYFNGHIVDLLYTTSMFALSLGLSMLSPNILDNKKDRN